jgi:Holliday junction resolvase RusA-like endonuclease
MTGALEVTVIGDPVGQGRVTTYGRGMTVHSNAKVLKPWREKIAWQVRQEMAVQGVDLIPKDQPVELHATFTVARPKSAPRLRWAPIVRPDLDHYVRALGDALSGVLIEEDSQIVSIYASKVYPHPGAVPGVTFVVSPAERGESVAA